MNKFDELMMLNDKLDAVLNDMKKANYHLENELKAKRDAVQKQMFDDIAVLRNYIKKVGMSDAVLNTGINTTCNNGFVAAITVSTTTTDIGLRTMKVTNNKDFAFHYWFNQDIPIAEAQMNWHNEYCRDYMYTIMKNWDVAYANMQNDLFNKIQDFMEKKASEVAKKQSNLVAALDDFDKKE